MALEPSTGDTGEQQLRRTASGIRDGNSKHHQPRVVRQDRRWNCSTEEKAQYEAARLQAGNKEGAEKRGEGF